MTGSASPALLAAVRTPPPVFTLAKPFNEEALLDVIGRAVAARPGE
jgi:hypothetical protein